MTKYLYATAKSFDAKARTLEAWASKPEVDREGEVVLPAAFDLTDFKKHPIGMLGHDYKSGVPLFRVVDIRKSDQGLWFKAKFPTSGAGGEAFDVISELDGLAAFSVSFGIKQNGYTDMSKAEVRAMGIDVTRAPDRIRVYRDVELYEISLVSIPACASATAIGHAFTAGRIHNPELAMALKGWTDKGDFLCVPAEEVEELTSPSVRGLGVAIPNPQGRRGMEQTTEVQFTKAYPHIDWPHFCQTRDDLRAHGLRASEKAIANQLRCTPNPAVEMTRANLRKIRETLVGNGIARGRRAG